MCCSSFQNSEDQLEIVTAAPSTILEEEQATRSPGSGRVRVLKRQMCRESSSDTLVDVIAGTVKDEFKPQVRLVHFRLFCS